MLETSDLTAHYGKNEVVSDASIVLNAAHQSSCKKKNKRLYRMPESSEDDQRRTG